MKTYLKSIPESYTYFSGLSKRGDGIGELPFVYHICTEFNSDDEMKNKSLIQYIAWLI